MWSVAEKWDLEPQQGGVNRMPPAGGVDQVRVRLHISERGFLYGQIKVISLWRDSLTSVFETSS